MNRPNRNRRRYLALAAATALVASYSHQTQGQTFNVSWDGIASGAYATATNWSTDVVPNNNVGLGDFFNVTINRLGGAAVTLNADPTILNLTIGANAGNALVMGDARQLTLIGANGGGAITLSNSATLSLGTTAASTASLFLNGTSANISGGGTLLMLGSSVLSGAGTVTSNNQIIGTGNLGNNAIAIINNGTVTASGGTLTLDARSSGGFVNNGMLQALANGTMVFSGNGGGSFTNTGGTISAATATSRVNLMDGATIVGGTISTFGFNTSIFFVPGGHTATLSGVTSTADVNVAIGSTLNLLGTITNNGRIRTNNSAGVTTYDAGASTITLNGTGSLVLSQFAGAQGNLIGTGTLINGTTHTIAGAGTIGNNTLSINNDGTISASLSGQTLVIDPDLSARNTGTLEARNGGTLRLVGPTFFENSTGRIVAADASSVVELTNAVQVSLGEFAGPGVVRVPTANTALAINALNSGKMEVANNATLTIGGFFTNTGTISVLAGANVTSLQANLAGGTVTLSGGGTVILSGTQARLVGAGAGTFVNNANIIRGQGAIGLGSMALSNAGTISADVAGGILVVEPSSQGMANTGTLEARNGSKMFLSGASGGVFNNNAGTLLATELNSSINLSEGAVLNGGTLITAPSNTGVNVQFGQTATVNNVNNRGRMIIQDGGTMNVGGGMVNDGTVVISSAGLDTNLRLSGGTVTFSGGGRVQLAQSEANSAIFGGAGTLVNSLGHRIVGAGRLGNNTLSIRNGGLIDANVEGKLMVMDNSVGPWVNTGTMQASNGGTLELNGTGGGSQLGNTGGRIIADDFSNVSLNGVFLNGGTLTTNGTGTISLAPSSTATISFLTNSGHVVVERLRTLKLDGDIINTGTISVVPSTSNATIEALAGSELNNDGTILMKNVDGISSSPQLLGSAVLNNNGLIRGDGVIDAALGGSTFTINNAGVIESDAFALNLGSLQVPPPALVINNTGTIRMRPSTGNNTIGTNVEISGSGAFEVQSNSALLSFGKFNIPAITLNGGMAQAANSASLGNVSGGGSLIVGFSFFGGPAPGDVTVNHLRGLNTVAIQAGTLTTTAGGGTLGTSFIEGTLTIGSLGPARWNLTDHDLVLDYAGASALPSIQNHIATARNGGTWDGSGLTSTSARDNATHNTTLGAIEATDFIAANGTTTFSGQVVDGTTVLVKYTYYGDTDFNGVVNFDDYSRTDAGLNNNRTGWFNGDFDLNGGVNFDDYALIDLAFNTQSGVLSRAMSFLDGSDRSDRGMDSPALQLVQQHFEQFGSAYATSFLNNVPEPAGGLLFSGVAAAIGLRAGRRRKIDR